MFFLSVFFIILWPRKKTMFVPGVLVALWPCAMLTRSMAIAVVHVYFVEGLLANFS